jgi:hypothetical protein
MALADSVKTSKSDRQTKAYCSTSQESRNGEEIDQQEPQAIRDALQANPEKSPSEIAKGVRCLLAYREAKGIK